METDPEQEQFLEAETCRLAVTLNGQACLQVAGLPDLTERERQGMLAAALTSLAVTYRAKLKPEGISNREFAQLSSFDFYRGLHLLLDKLDERRAQG